MTDPQQPIRNRDHQLRAAPGRPCEKCGQWFHPWVNSAGRFCSTECMKAAGIDAKEILRQKRETPQ